MVRKILIANRGEIALRIMRACMELDLRTVVAYSEADRDSLPVLMAEERICIGPGASSKSYLHIPNIVSAALLTGCDAIHPGYGFLSENTTFVEICTECGLTFIGPPPEAVQKMSDKVMARRLMAEAGLPVLTGSPILHSISEGERVAAELGYPLMLKAAAGGGGRGIRLVHQPQELTAIFPTAQSEVREAFNDDGLYLEHYIEHARHIEIQLLIDRYGNGVHLGERNCSLQRRHQKVLEEAPSVRLSPELREEIGAAALKAALSIGYSNVGTMEFLLDANDRYYFMEMNTRLQVEHPVTEQVTSIDIVKEQIKLAAGDKLDIAQRDVMIRGHSIECRITAEDARANFQPTSGTVTNFRAPGGPGVRFDTHLYTGYTIPPHYDSLLGKLITWGNTREEAIVRAQRALHEMIIEGITTTIPFHRQLLTNRQFMRGDTYTNFLQEQVHTLVG